MLVPASREDIRKIGEPLSLLINSTSWNDPNFDIRRSGALTIVAHLAYCAVDSNERKHPHRAKVVPCHAYQRLVVAEDIDFIEVMRSGGLDFDGTGVVRTKRFVAIIVPVIRKDMILVGVRGTQFAYDWAINLRMGKRQVFDDVKFHAGFYGEAEKLVALINEFLVAKHKEILDKPGRKIFFTGHSLGGAVAAVASQWRGSLKADGCYTYGSPRVCSASTMRAMRQPFATRRPLDIVPHCPPSLFNYANFKIELSPAGAPFKSADRLEMYFFVSWILSLTMSSFLENHSMENYRAEVLEIARQQPNVQPYWKYPALAFLRVDRSSAYRHDNDRTSATSSGALTSGAP